ncbi:MAG: PAS domain-containing protein, partial [Pseudomonadota bacterium]
MENVESRQLRRRLAGALLLCVFAMSVIVWQTSPVIAASVTVLAVIVAFWMPSGARQRIPLQRLEALTEMKSVLLFDANGKVSWANDAFLDLLGASLDRLVGRSHDALFASIAQTTYQDLWQALCQGENSTGVYELVHSAGHTLWIRALLVPVMNKAGRLSHVVQYAVDISEQKKRAAQDVRVRSAFDNSNSCMMIADDDGSVIYMNDAMNALLVSAEDDLRKAYPWFDATKMLGINIDQFSIVSSQQSRSLSTTMQADWSLGDRSLRLSVNPVVDKRNDQRVGTLVEWQDRTHEFAAEREIQAVVDAARGGDLSRRIDPTGMHGFLRQFSDS